MAFDVYKAVGGSERLRVWTMKFLRYGFVVGMSGCRSSFRCWATARPTAAACSGRAGAASATPRLSSARLWDQLRDYDRRDFHPDDSDTNALVEQWRAELFGEQGTLERQALTRRRREHQPRTQSTSTS